MTVRSIALFVLAAVCEIGGAWLIWQAVKEGEAWWWGLAGGAALVAYGFVAALQADANFGRVLAAYDIAGAAICLIGVGVIMYSRGRVRTTPNVKPDETRPESFDLV